MGTTPLWSSYGYTSPPKPANIFANGHWRGIAFVVTCGRMFLAFGSVPVAMVQLSLTLILASCYLLYRGLYTIVAGALHLRTRPRNAAWVVLLWAPPGLSYAPFYLLNQYWPSLSWALCLIIFDSTTFVDEFRYAWQHELSLKGQVTEVTICLGQETLAVRILFEKDNNGIGNDQETFRMLRMWYNCMQCTRGFSELLLLRKLTRIFSVSLCGTRAQAFELGGFGTSHVANFEDPTKISADQRFQTEKMVADASIHGLEFVRTWETRAISMIALAPFVLSLIFAGAWIGVSVDRYGVDPQVATQTAFTEAAFIVTAVARALIIALFAFLDSQADKAQ